MGLYGVVYLGLETILTFLQVPAEVYPLIRQYLLVVFSGLLATFLYNFFACLLRALGNSLTPLLFLGISAVLNVVRPEILAEEQGVQDDAQTGGKLSNHRGQSRTAHAPGDHQNLTQGNITKTMIYFALPMILGNLLQQ